MLYKLDPQAEAQMCCAGWAREKALKFPTQGCKSESDCQCVAEVSPKAER